MTLRNAILQSMTNRPAVRGVLFDWDGTLVDSYHADSQAYLTMFQAMGVNWGLPELEQYYSPDWYAVYRAAKIPEHRWDEADRVWREHYAKHPCKLMAPTRRVLAQLAKRHKLGLVSSGDRARVSRQLREFGLTTMFDTHVLGGDTRRKKPHPEPLLKALREMGLDPRNCVYVGDTPEDMQMAQAAGVRAIAVLGPFPTEKRLRASQPEILLNGLQELPKALRAMFTGGNASRA
jgi:HAD superfamily hydrolase (TIGR01509 family)